MTDSYDETTGEVYDQPNGAPPAGAIVRRDGLGAEIVHVTETASMAMAARQEKTIEARHVTARRFPRDIGRVHERIVAACKRPRFAEAAIYRKPVGKQLDQKTGQWADQFAEGPSIRLVEACVQEMGNLAVEVVTIADTPESRTIEITATDYESGAVWSDQQTIAKTVEKSRLPKGRKVMAQRVNSRGYPTFLVEATDDEMALKVAAIKSKVARTLAQRLIPADILEDACDQVEATLAGEAKRDPDGVKGRMIAGFAESGISSADLAEYLGGVSADQATPAQVRELRKVYRAIADGDTLWADVLAASPYRKAPEIPAAEAATPASSVTEKAKAVAAAAKAKTAKKQEAPPVAEAPAPTANPDDDGR